VAEVGVGVVGEPHGDEAKLVAWSAGPDGGRWSLSAWRRPGRRKKAPGLATGLADAWRRTGARRQITRLVARWYGSSTAGEQRARGGEQRNARLHSMARSRAAAKEKFPPRRCFTRIRLRGGARGGDTAWPARGGGAVAWPRVANTVTRRWHVRLSGG
jgi:hypothetical protein